MKQNEISNLKKFWTAGGNWIVEIPKFQRPYSWKDKLIKQMLEDVENIDLDCPQIEKLFFGSMYFKSIKDMETDFDVLQIIDGQQRLLTTFILLIVIKNCYHQVFENQGLTICNPGNNSSRIRFITKVGDDQDVINLLSNGSIDEISNHSSKIYKCYETIRKFFDRRTKNYSADELKKYFDSFFQKLSNCEIAINELDDNNNMFQVFQSINHKTEPLTIRDLLNNYILKFGEQNDQIIQIWDHIRHEFNEKLDKKFKFEYLLRYFFQYIFKKDIKINDLLNTFCNTYNSADKVYDIILLFNEFIKFVADLQETDEYSILFKDKKILLGQLFYCYKEYRDMYDGFKKILFSWLIRRNICELDSKGITNIIPILIPTILNNNNNQFTWDSIKSYFGNQRGKNASFPTDSDLQDKLINTNFYSKYNISRPILVLIEKKSYYRSNFDINNLNDATIEHVFSQHNFRNLNDGMSEEERYKIINSIGNLTLLPGSLNSSLGDMNFQQKKNYILQNGSQYKMNGYFNKINSWGVEEIKERSKVFFNFIKELFPSVF